MVHEAVDGCRSGHRVLEDALPLGEGQVAGDHDAAAFLALGQQREEHLHVVAAVLNISDVVEDERIVTGDAFLEGQTPAEHLVAYYKDRPLPQQIRDLLALRARLDPFELDAAIQAKTCPA